MTYWLACERPHLQQWGNIREEPPANGPEHFCSGGSIPTRQDLGDRTGDRSEQRENHHHFRDTPLKDQMTDHREISLDWWENGGDILVRLTLVKNLHRLDPVEMEGPPLLTIAVERLKVDRIYEH